MNPLGTANCTTEGFVNPDNVQGLSASRRRRSADPHVINKRQTAPSESSTLLVKN